MEFCAVVNHLVLPHLPSNKDASVLVTGDLAADLVRCLRSSGTDVNCKCETAERILVDHASMKTYTDAVVAQRSADVSTQKQDHLMLKNLLCRVRDVHAEKVLHLVISDSGNSQSWTLSDSLAMGFVKLAELPVEAGLAALYEFNIRSYKTDPDWLNSKHWAHPERWDQGRR